MVFPGIVNVDYPAYFGYLLESERELLRIAMSRCRRLHDESQLSAVVFLLIRAMSLFRSVLLMMSTRQALDACDAVRRAYLEAWFLAFEFRLQGSESKAAGWHKGKSGTWSADIKRLANYCRSQGIIEPTLGPDYGGLSRVAHPTKDAASNSVNVVAAPYDKFEESNINAAKASLEAEMPMMMYRFLWLIIEERAGLIPTGADISALPTAFAYVNEYVRFSGRTVEVGR